MTAAANIIQLSERHASGCGRSLLSRYDKRWAVPMTVELATESFDPDLLGIGSTPWVGDASAFGVRVPAAPTRFQNNRYLIRLLSIDIGLQRALLIRGIWQYATIRVEGPQRAADCNPVPTELEVTSPGWHFADGNISWHLRWEPNQFSEESVFDPSQQPGTSPTRNGTDAALLYVPPLLPYQAPGAGIPPGTDVDYLGTIREMRYLDRQSRELAIPVFGPGRITFYASVHQTDPVSRCPLSMPIGLGRPEDQFVSYWQEADAAVIYGRVAAGLAVDLFPCCDDLLKGHP